MRLKKDFITHAAGGENFLVPLGNNGFSGLIKGNDTAAMIFEYLKKDTTEKEIVDRLYEKFDAPREQIAADVRKILIELKKCGALVK